MANATKPRKQVTLQELCSLYERLGTIYKVADEIGRTPQAVSQRLIKAGIKVRKTVILPESK
jgi:hypothetical protein